MAKASRAHKKEVKEWIASRPAGHCPFVKDPFDECFVTGINSQNIDQAIYYCGGHFEECEIYRKRGGKRVSR